MPALYVLLFLALFPTTSATHVGGTSVADPAWSTNFTSDDGTFLIDDGSISHCPDCIYETRSHVSFSADGVRLLLSQSPCNASSTACCVGSVCARFAAGHMRSAAVQAFGTYTFTARPSFPPLGQGAPPGNSFACLTTSYLGSPHHEVASCFSGGAPTEVSLAYWAAPHNANGVIKRVDTGVQLHDAFHTYSVTWTPTSLALSLDGVLVASASAPANTTIPSLAGNALLINRVSSTEYDGDAVVALRHAAFEPAK